MNVADWGIVGSLRRFGLWLLVGACGGNAGGGPLSDGGCTCVADADCPAGETCKGCRCRAAPFAAGADAGVPALAVDCDLDFGAPLIGAGTELAFTVRNAGGGELLVAALVVAEHDPVPEFALGNVETPFVLDGGEERELTLSLRPIDAEPDTGTLTIGSNVATAVCALASEFKGEPELYVCAPLGELACSTGVLDFGTVAWGESASADLLVRNVGDGNRPIVVEQISGSDADALEIFTYWLDGEEESAAELPVFLNPAGEGEEPNDLYVRVTFSAQEPDGLFEDEHIRIESDLEPPDDVAEVPVQVAIDGCGPGCWDLDPDAPGCELCGCAFQDAVDSCDLEDDDCDGNVDEDFDPGLCGDGACAATAACVAGEVVCGEAAADDSVCDGEDDDCDGATDEDYQPYTCGVGTCVAVSVCDAGVPSCTAGAGSAETCANVGADDDCDGDPTEIADGIHGGDACASGEDGVCADGEWTCATGLLACPALRVPSDEVCNDLDDDCDGEADDLCDDDGDGFCRDGMAIVGSPAACPSGGDDCDDDDDARHPGAVEACNGVDEDCDVLVDEGFALGFACDGADADFCAEGETVCDAAGDGVVCDDVSGDNVEDCDGADDDCDALTDEGFGIGIPCDGPDADFCPEGLMACAGCTDDAAENDLETCNFADDDCDGSVDEGFGVGLPCDGTDTDFCATGSMTCAGCGDDAAADGVESCNGADDDCDGLVDEDFSLGSVCDGSDSDACMEGIVTCAGCVEAPPDDDVETCNGFDDDCDGVIDDGSNVCGGVCAIAPTVEPGDPCDFGGPGDLDTCADDAYACSGLNATVCTDVDTDGDDDNYSAGAMACAGDCADGDPDRYPGAAELCNPGVDDDCDGTIDEGTNACGGACTLSNLPGASCDFAGAVDLDTCEDDYYVCTSLNATDCANLDTDADDDFYSPGAAACAGDCADGDPARSPADPELCNTLDDDCDGFVDEGTNPCGGVCAIAPTVEPLDPCDFIGAADLDTCEDDAYACAGWNATVCANVDTDADDDNYGAGAMACAGDCADGDPARHPGATELCNPGVDDDCDGTIDEGTNACGGACTLANAPGTPCDFVGPADLDTCNDDYYTCTTLNSTDCANIDTDADNDNYSPGSSTCSGDCADGDLARSPAATEVCDSLDNDCDTSVDEGFGVGNPCDGPDTDNCNEGVTTCTGCSDVSSDNVEICNGLDDDCDLPTPIVDEGFDFTSPSTCGNCTTVCALGLSCNAGSCVTPDVGSIIITEVMIDPTVVFDTAGEWFEVYNTASYPIDLRTWEIKDLGTNTHVITYDTPVLVPPGGYRVLGNQRNPAFNGGVTEIYQYSGILMANTPSPGADELLLRIGATVIDQVADWVTADVSAGRSRQLTATALTAAANDLDANWCSSSTLMTNGVDYGTPGAANITCP